MPFRFPTQQSYSALFTTRGPHQKDDAPGSCASVTGVRSRSRSMDLSKIACRRLAMLFACCGIMAQLAAASPAMELPLAVPGSPKPPADAPAGGSDATQGANEELVALKAKLQTATQAFETLKKELAPRLAE